MRNGRLTHERFVICKCNKYDKNASLAQLQEYDKNAFAIGEKLRKDNFR
jgi:hypothetical protein